MVALFSYLLLLCHQKSSLLSLESQFSVGNHNVHIHLVFLVTFLRSEILIKSQCEENLPSRDAHKFFSSSNNANLDRMSVDKLYRKIPARIRLSPIFLCSDRINGMFDNYRSACIKVISPMFPYRIYGVVWTSDWLILPFMCYMFFLFPLAAVQFK